MLEVKGLSKDFDGKRVVDRVSFSLERGEVVGLLGPNGAGKTTLLYMILGIVEPSEGSVQFDGRDLFRHRGELLSRINFFSSYTQMPFNLTVRENLLVFAKIYGVKRARERVEELLEVAGASHLADRKTGELSSGEMTRVNLCKGLVNWPELLLMDEPTASLDPVASLEVQRLLRRLASQRGMTMLITSHNMRHVEATCDRVLLMRRGSLIYDGPIGEIGRRFSVGNLEELFVKSFGGGEAA